MWEKSPEFLNLYLKSNRFKEISDLVLLDENKLYFSCIGPGSYRYEGILDLNEHSAEFGKHSNNYSPFILCSDGNYVYAYYDPARLRKSIGDKSKNNQIFDRFVSEMKGTYNEKSNLILVRFSLKK